MMTNKEQLEKEGLLITEFSDDWFEREASDFKVDEIEKDITELKDKLFIFDNGLVRIRKISLR